MSWQLSSSQEPKNIFKRILWAFFSLTDEKTISISDFAFRFSLLVIIVVAWAKLFQTGLNAYFSWSDMLYIISFIKFIKPGILLLYCILFYIFVVLLYKRWRDAWYSVRMLEHLILAMGILFMLYIVESLWWMSFLYKIAALTTFGTIAVIILGSIIVLTPSKDWIHSNTSSNSWLLKILKLGVFACMIYFIVNIVRGAYIISSLWLSFSNNLNTILRTLELWIVIFVSALVIASALYDTLKKKTPQAPEKSRDTINPEIKQAIDIIDIDWIEYVRFKELEGRSYNILLDSVKRIFTVILNKTGKYAFQANELSSEKALIFSYFYSTLPREQANILEENLTSWFEKGWSFEIIRKQAG